MMAILCMAAESWVLIKKKVQQHLLRPSDIPMLFGLNITVFWWVVWQLGLLQLLLV